jgi:hypothetical protein
MTWRVQISGEKADLDALSKSFKDDDLCVIAEDDKYFLESTRLEIASAADEVLKIAGDILSVLSGVARLAYRARVPLSPGHVLRIHTDGRRDVFIQVSDALHIRGVLGNVTLTYSDGTCVTIETHDPSRDWVRAAEKDEAVSKALRLFGSDAEDWVGLYRLFEVIEQDVGGIMQIVATGWATEDSIRRFKHTANSPAVTGDLARHGREKTQPPKKPMDLSEASALIEVILHSWLRAKGEGICRQYT